MVVAHTPAVDVAQHNGAAPTSTSPRAAPTTARRVEAKPPLSGNRSPTAVGGRGHSNYASAGGASSSSSGGGGGGSGGGSNGGSSHAGGSSGSVRRTSAAAGAPSDRHRDGDRDGYHHHQHQHKGTTSSYHDGHRRIQGQEGRDPSYKVRVGGVM
jgi:hypothetical protein